jgi:hypothetical protein
VTMLCVSLSVGATLVATIALAALDRQRRLFFVSHAQGPDGDPKIVGESGGRRARLRHTLSKIWGPIVRIMFYPAAVWVPSPVRRPEHAARRVLRVVSKASPRPNMLPTKPLQATDPPTGTLTGPQSAGDVLASNASAAEGIVRVDRRGQLKSADPIARDLLHWDRGELTLSAILGGEREAAAMLETLARQEVVEQTVTVRNGASAEQLHATALASRGSAGSLSGVLLFLRRP